MRSALCSRRVTGLMQPMSSLPRFEQLALEHLEAAYNLAFWLVRSRPDAEDVVQDAYLRALRAFKIFTARTCDPGCSPSCATPPTAGSTIAAAPAT